MYMPLNLDIDPFIDYAHRPLARFLWHHFILIGTNMDSIDLFEAFFVVACFVFNALDIIDRALFL